MPEVGSGGDVPHGEDLDPFPGDIFPQAHDKAGAFVRLVELLIGDDEAGGKVSEIGSGSAPPVNVGAREHVEIGDLEGAIIDYLNRAAELMLEHFEFGFRVDEGAGLGATRIGMAECEEEEEDGEKP